MRQCQPGCFTLPGLIESGLLRFTPVWSGLAWVGNGTKGSCVSVQSMQSWGVPATLTELRRKTGKVLGPVIHAGQSVDITSQGQVVASISPRPKGLSGKEFVRLWRSGPRLGKELADELAQSLKELDQADYETQRKLEAQRAD